jgi:hypothetical protein
MLIYKCFIDGDGRCILQKAYAIMNKANGKNNEETWAM